MVDDDEEDFLITHDMLKLASGGNISVEWASTYQAGHEKIQSGHYHAVLVDYDLGARSGIDLIREVSARGYPSPLILFTGRGGYDIDLEAMQAGASLYLPKGDASPANLERFIRYAIENKSMKTELDRTVRERLTILESIQDGLMGIDWDWRITYINPVAARNGGYAPEELVGINIWQAYPKILGTPLEEHYRRVMTERVHTQFEMRGAYQGQWYNISVYPSAEGISVYWQDITQRKNAEQALQNREQDFRQLFESMQEIFFICEIVRGEDGVPSDIRYLEVNPACLAAFGLTREQMAGRTHLEIFPPNPSFAAWLGHLNHVVETGQPDHFEQFSEAAGRWFDVAAYNPRPGACAALLTDITERKRSEVALAANAHELERSNRELQEFAFVASHDLQEPLRKIESFSRLLLDTFAVVHEGQRDLVERIQSAAARMRGMIDALLQIARIDIDASPFQQVDLNQVLQEVVSNLELQMKQDSGSVQVCDLPVIEADNMQMTLLFQNLISNGLKFHRPGTVPKVVVWQGEAPLGYVQIQVKDNGIGFSEQFAEQVFEPFRRLVGKHEFAGSGIGLAIARKIVERHNGSIHARSRPGRGSIFTITLPLRQDRQLLTDLPD